MHNLIARKDAGRGYSHTQGPPEDAGPPFPTGVPFEASRREQVKLAPPKSHTAAAATWQVKIPDAGGSPALRSESMESAPDRDDPKTKRRRKPPRSSWSRQACGKHPNPKPQDRTAAENRPLTAAEGQGQGHSPAFRPI